ncbi:MAG: amino acid adenylation domain-containing protein, partial [bacterium]|nr:amino acid adenylation domain-containing protein [bacterium]
LYEFNDTQADYPGEKTIHQLFEEQVERTPDHISLVGSWQLAVGKEKQVGSRQYAVGNENIKDKKELKENKKIKNNKEITVQLPQMGAVANVGGIHESPLQQTVQLTYRELNEKSDRLAALLREKGVEADVIVAIMAERSIEMIIGIIGVLKAGGAYLPIAPDYPEARKQFMLADSCTPILLTTSSPAVGIEFNKEILNIKDAITTDNPQPASNIRHPASSLAYVIYTSGSTGKPKGVMIGHGSAVNYICWAIRQYTGEAGSSRFPFYTSISFDLTVTSLFTPLLSGNAVIIYGEKNSGEGLRKIIESNNVNIVKLTPSHLKLLDELELSSTCISQLIVGGEALSATLAGDIYKKFHKTVSIYNEYGPTEATVGCMVYKYISGENTGRDVPIGLPADNVRIYLLDTAGQPVPVGVSGQLYIAGEGLARGYLNRPELTVERFVTVQSSTINNQSLITGNRFYRTGDLAKWLPGGNIEFLGRIDHQVKIRGFRIELGEIENLLLSINNIKEAVVVAKKDKESNNYLAAYYVQNDPGTNEQQALLSITQLIDFLSEKLPGYMIPAYFVPLEKLPLTPNGKIDRNALPEPSVTDGAGTRYEAPGTPIEKKLVKVWQKVLGNKSIGIHDSFFHLGGDSIKAIQVAAQLQKYGLRMEIKDLFLQLTISKFAPFIKDKIIEAQQGTISGDVKPTPIQQWFFNLDFTSKHHWNQGVMLYKKEGFDENIVPSVLKALVCHHDALRMSYPAPPVSEGKNPVRQYNRGLEGELFSFSLKDFRTETSSEDLEKRIGKQADLLQASIGLAAGPLVKTVLFKALQGDHLLLVIHHLVVDGVSWRIL